ncbi:dephospho-CoA kinase [Candidatus Woesearchaeota archaeon]|nr:dephospho-CoA kinase [Candidatus Woesearchaeota archaeon]|tara:strand:- start:1585 stop:2214 length:630 start_codon:yes stop_codon:yes gene_type:complete
MIIGITGSFGSGKTTVANMFKKHGFRVINADKLYHGLYENEKPLRKKILEEFKTLNRDKIKKIVFKDYKKLKRLNVITHPIIIKSIKKEINKIKKHYKRKTMNKKINEKNLLKIKNKNKIIIDAPLLIEAKAQKLVDKIIVVKCSKKEQIKRLLKNKKYSKKEIEQIIKSQMPLRGKIKRAGFVVDNSKDLDHSKKQVKDIISILNSIR